jgi:replication-associated recombination protein RarA
MLSETYRPTTFSEIIGHTEAKELLASYLLSNTPSKAILIAGSAGIGKTTLALTAARTFDYEPLEINASRSLRSHEDVANLRSSCMAGVSFTSLVKYSANPRKTCVILDEIDGSDPHAQRKILDWIKDPHRVVPIICTANEVPIIFRRASDSVTIHRCMPLNARDIYENLKTSYSNVNFTDFQVIVKECQHDVRRLMNRLQYGVSDVLRQTPLTGDPIADLMKHQEMFYSEYPTCFGL